MKLFKYTTSKPRPKPRRSSSVKDEFLPSILHSASNNDFNKSDLCDNKSDKQKHDNPIQERGYEEDSSGDPGYRRQNNIWSIRGYEPP